MKKLLVGLAVFLGVIVSFVVIIAVFGYRSMSTVSTSGVSSSVSVIGGADGPTAVFVAGGTGINLTFWVLLGIIGIILLIAGIIIYIKSKND